MKKGIITVVAAGAIASLSYIYAQTDTNAPPVPPPPSGQQQQQQGGERFNRLSEELNLTEDQKPKVQAIFEQLRTSIEEAKTNAETQLQAVLTPEQYQKLQSHWQMRKHHWREQGEEGGTNTDTNAESNTSTNQ